MTTNTYVSLQLDTLQLRIAPNAKFQRVLVLALCVVSFATVHRWNKDWFGAKACNRSHNARFWRVNAKLSDIRMNEFQRRLASWCHRRLLTVTY